MSPAEPHVYRPAARVPLYLGIALFASLSVPTLASPASLRTGSGLLAVLFPLLCAAPLVWLLLRRVVLAPSDDGKSLRVRTEGLFGAEPEQVFAASDLASVEVESRTVGARISYRVVLVRRDGSRHALTESFWGGRGHEPTVEALRRWLERPAGSP